MKKSTAVALATVTAISAAPGTAAAQTSLAVDPIQPCYREQSRVRLPGAGYTPNAVVTFTRDGLVLPSRKPVTADASGQFVGTLDLPGLVSGQRRLTYVGTDASNSAVNAEVTLLVTATDVELLPEDGPPHRLLNVRARGFFLDEQGRGSNTLYAHVVRVRRGRPARRARNLAIGRVKGRCRQVGARKRLFRRGVAPGRYRIQFDTFRRYRPGRTVKTEYDVTVFRTAGSARASGLSPAS